MAIPNFGLNYKIFRLGPTKFPFQEQRHINLNDNINGPTDLVELLRGRAHEN